MCKETRQAATCRSSIDPDKLYPFSEAAALIPSCRAGKRLFVRTLHTWRTQGRFRAECREFGTRRYWFVWGSELLKLLPPKPVWHGRTPAQARRAHERAMASLRAAGVID